mgnify:CR=1 FL=1
MQYFGISSLQKNLFEYSSDPAYICIVGTLLACPNRRVSKCYNKFFEWVHYELLLFTDVILLSPPRIPGVESMKYKIGNLASINKYPR